MIKGGLFVLGGVYELIFGKTSGPQETRYKDFKSYFGAVKDYENEPFPDEIIQKLDIPQTEVEFYKTLIYDKAIKGDYLESVELTLNLLNEGEYALRACGGISNARWMCRLLYETKTYTRRKSLGWWIVDDELMPKIERFLMYFVKIHIPKWIRCGDIFEAGINYLRHYQTIKKYEVSEAQ